MPDRHNGDRHLHDRRPDAGVNPGVIPYGTHVWLYLDDGTLVGDYYAEDTGSNMLAHPYVIDIYMGTDYDTCIEWGVQHVSVYVEKDAAN